MTTGEITAGATATEIRTAHPDAVHRSLLGCVVFPASALVLTLLTGFGGVQGWPPGLAALLGLLFFALHVALIVPRASSVDPLIWIPVAMLLFYFATPLSLALDGPNSSRSYDTWGLGVPMHLSEGYFTALVTLVAFLSGVHLTGLVSAAGPARPAAAVGTQIRVPCFIIAAGALGMMMVGIVIVGPGLLFGSYGEIWEAKAAGLDVRLLEVGFLFCQGAAIGLLASHRRGNTMALLAGVSLSSFLLIYSLLTGDRAALISFGLPAAWVFSRAIYRIPWPPILVAAFVGLLLMPVIKEYREMRRIEQTGSASVRALLVGTLYETGSTVQVFGHTLDHIPSEKPYDYGFSVVYSTLALIPNFGLSQGKSFLPNPLLHQPSLWLTYTLNRAKWEEGGGYGFAIGAEWYFNFGLPGVLFGMAWVGWLVTIVRNRAMASSLRLMLSGSIFLMLLLLVRNASSAPFKVALWSVVGVLILRAVLGFVGVGRERSAGAGEWARPA